MEEKEKSQQDEMNKDNALKMIDEIKDFIEKSGVEAIVMIVSNGERTVAGIGGQAGVIGGSIMSSFTSVPNLFPITKQACMEYQFQQDVIMSKQIIDDENKQSDISKIIPPNETHA